MSEFGQNVNSPVLYFQFHRGLQVFRNFFVPWQRDIEFLLTLYFHKNPPNLICNHFSCYSIVFVSGLFAFVFVDWTNAVQLIFSIFCLYLPSAFEEISSKQLVFHEKKSVNKDFMQNLKSSHFPFPQNFLCVFDNNLSGFTKEIKLINEIHTHTNKFCRSFC